MAFLALKLSYDRARTEYNQKAYEETIGKSVLNSLTEKIDDIEATAGSKDNLKNNSAYQDLVAYQMAYDTKLATLETEMKTLKADMDSFKEAMTKGVQEESSWSCFA